MRMLTLVLVVLALSAFIGCQSNPMDGSDGQSANEGIKVHGDWVIEVRNPDGSLATRKQFANSFDGQHIVAALLSLDLEVERGMSFFITDTPSGNSWSEGAQCKDSPNAQGRVPANAIHASNDDGDMNNSVWNASCTLEINGDESKFINTVKTRMRTTPPIQKLATEDAKNQFYNLSRRELDDPIEVWDGQVVAATVILSVD